MSNQYWSWVLTIVGLIGFFLAGKKVWWCWYVNIANQVIWVTYAIITEQWGFLIGAIAYTWVFTQNAYSWTRDRNKIEIRKPIGKITGIIMGPDGLTATGIFYEDEV